MVVFNTDRKATNGADTVYYYWNQTYYTFYYCYTFYSMSQFDNLECIFHVNRKGTIHTQVV